MARLLIMWMARLRLQLQRNAEAKNTRDPKRVVLAPDRDRDHVDVVVAGLKTDDTENVLTLKDVKRKCSNNKTNGIIEQHTLCGGCYDGASAVFACSRGRHNKANAQHQ